MGGSGLTDRIGKRVVDNALPRSGVYRLWDTDLKGFGLKVMPTGVKTYFVWYRAGSGRLAARREFTIGRHGPFTPEKARKEAERILSAVRQGEDPQIARQGGRCEMSVSELCDLYLIEGVTTKKPSTIASDRTRIAAHIKPLLGRLPVSAVSRADVERFLRHVATGRSAVVVKPSRPALKAAGVRVTKSTERRRRTDPVASGGQGTASRTVGLLGGIFTFAVERKLRADNPVRGVQRYRDKRSQRYLTPAELERLALALADAGATAVSPMAVAIIRLLVLTGARRSEIEHLRWRELDLEHSCLRLMDSKTGARVVPIGAPARELLAAVPRIGTSAYVFPSAVAGKNGAEMPYSGAKKLWENRLRSAAGLDGVRLHDLRHTYASLAVAGGASLPLIGAILGHRDVRTTAQYAHLADDPVKALAERTSAAAAAAMAGTTAEILPLKRA